ALSPWEEVPGNVPLRQSRLIFLALPFVSRASRNSLSLLASRKARLGKYSTAPLSSADWARARIAGENGPFQRSMSNSSSIRQDFPSSHYRPGCEARAGGGPVPASPAPGS